MRGGGGRSVSGGSLQRLRLHAAPACANGFQQRTIDIGLGVMRSEGCPDISGDSAPPCPHARVNMPQ